MGLRLSTPGGSSFSRISSSDDDDGSVVGFRRRIERVFSVLSRRNARSLRALEAAVDALRIVNLTLGDLRGTIKKDPDLLQAVADYLRTTSKILTDSLRVLEMRMDEARRAEGILQEAMQYFRLKDYDRTMKYLRNFTSLEDPFGSMTRELIEELHSAYEESESTLERLLQKYRDKKDSAKAWSSALTVVFLGLLVGAFIGTAMFPALSVPAVLVAIVGETGVFAAIRTALREILPDTVGNLSGIEEAIQMLKDESLGAKTELASIKSLVEHLQEKYDSMKLTCEQIRSEEEEMHQMLERSMENIRSNLVQFSAGLRKLEDDVNICMRHTRKNERDIVGKITGYKKAPWPERMIRPFCICHPSHRE